MFWKRVAAILSICILLGMSACGMLGAAPGSDSNPAVSTGDLQTEVAALVSATYAAQTSVANMVVGTLTALAGNNNGTASTPIYPSQDTNLPTDTPTPTPSFTPTPTFTITTHVPMVSVSSLTNLRSGPGSIYDLLGVFQPGDTAQVVGKYGDGAYWLIPMPGNPSEIVWLWGHYATVTGDTSGLQVFTAPPTPTPSLTSTPGASFIVAYSSLVTCSGKFSFKFKINNNGNVTWESNRTVVKDTDTNESVSLDRDVFPDFDGCTQGNTDQNLDPGEIGFTTSGDLSSNPAGHDISVTIRVCSKDGLSGTCIEKSFTFNP